MQLYITGTTAVAQGLDENLKDSGSNEMVPDNRSSTSRLYAAIFQSPFVEVRQGRPDLKPLISKEIDEAAGRMSISGIYLFTSAS